MCLAIPAKVAKLEEGNLATVDILGVTREISVDLTPQAHVGDYVLVHAGFAIEVVDEQFALETIELVKQFPDLADGFSVKCKLPVDWGCVLHYTGPTDERTASFGGRSSYVRELDGTLNVLFGYRSGD